MLLEDTTPEDRADTLVTEIEKLGDANLQATLKEKNLLQSRYIIENVFCRLKKFNRIAFRKDRSINSFKSFFYLGLVILTFENIKS